MPDEFLSVSDATVMSYKRGKYLLLLENNDNWIFYIVIFVCV